MNAEDIALTAHTTLGEMTMEAAEIGYPIHTM